MRTYRKKILNEPYRKIVLTARYHFFRSKKNNFEMEYGHGRVVFFLHVQGNTATRSGVQS